VLPDDESDPEQQRQELVAALRESDLETLQQFLLHANQAVIDSGWGLGLVVDTRERTISVAVRDLSDGTTRDVLQWDLMNFIQRLSRTLGK
jgi:hypothetical protein